MQAGRTVGQGSPRALRKAAARGDRVRLTGVGRDQLRASPRVRELVPMGAGWQLLLHSPDDVDPLQRELGVPLTRVAPSLEDVFIEACRRNP